jgi:hypothetical protein
MTKIKKLVILPDALVKRIKAEAKGDGVSDSTVVRDALEDWFGRLDEAAKKATNLARESGEILNAYKAGASPPRREHHAEKDAGRAIRVCEEAFEQLLHLQKLIIGHGWHALGRADTLCPPTLSAITEEAIATLANQEKQ